MVIELCITTKEWLNFILHLVFFYLTPTVLFVVFVIIIIFYRKVHSYLLNWSCPWHVLTVIQKKVFLLCTNLCVFSCVSVKLLDHRLFGNTTPKIKPGSVMFSEHFIHFLHKSTRDPLTKSSKQSWLTNSNY